MSYFNWIRKAKVFTYRIPSRDSRNYFTYIFYKEDNTWRFYIGNGFGGWRELQFNLG